MFSPGMQRLRSVLAVIVVLTLLWPTSLSFSAMNALAQTPETGTTAVPPVPTPVPTPDWPDIPPQSPYIPLFTPPQAPETQLLTAPTVVAAEEPAVVDTEAHKTGVVVGAASATLTPDGGQAALGALQLSLTSTAGALAQAVQVQADVLSVAEASVFSPVGLAFHLKFAPVIQNGAAASAVLAPQQSLSLTLDYSQIPLRYGGSFADRLTLYRAVPCQTTTATADCRTWEALPGQNDRVNQHLTVALNTLAAAPAATTTTLPPEANLAQRLYLPLVSNGTTTTTDDTLYVLAAAASGQQGTYQATPLANSTDYQVALATGAMQTSYPIPIPPAAGPLAPTVALQYDSGGVDGMTTNKNNQPGWTSIGWSWEPGYITRRLKTCALTQAPGDLCQTGDNYVLVLNGIATRLVKDGSNLYHPQNDPYWKIEKLTSGNSSHPDQQKEYWQVTMPNGTKYRFGGEFDQDKANADQNSAFYVPIYDTTLCSASTMGGAHYAVCNKVYKWNLDRVEDLNGNVISYYYNQEINYYAARTFIRAPYTRAGNILRIEYGRRTGSTTTPTQVLFNTEERCEGACVWPTNYPDTPGDLTCGSSGTCTQNAPTFWSRLRLNTVQTQYYNQGTSAWVNVALFDLDYSFPTPPNDADGDSSEKKLWLTQITQKTPDGLNSLPALQYAYTMLKNRRDAEGTGGAGISAMFMPRLNQLTNQLGGVVNFTYGKSHECAVVSSGFTEFPYDCYPAWFPVGSSPGFVLWNKWKVLSMTVSDSFSGNATETYTYSYSTPVNHYDDDPITPVSQKSYSDFRGSAIVTVTDASGAKTEHRFYRGMNGDTGGSITSITLSDGTTHQDDNWLRGREVETRRLTSASVAKQRTVTTFTSTLTAGSGTGGAYFVAVQQTDQTISDTTSKTIRVQYTYDSYGNVTREIRNGNTAITTNDRNLERSYVYNTTAYLVDKPAWEKLWTGTTSGTAGQEQAFTEYAYDTLAYGATPTKGNLTKSRAYIQTTPSAQSVETTTAYDSYGRPTTVTDARNKTTTTAYDAFYGYAASVTNALSQVTSTVKDPGWGTITQTTDANNNVTNLQYDGYGRLTKVWLPTEPTSGVASYEFVYDAAARPATVKTRQLQVKASSTYLESWQYVDGFGRTLQSQTLASGGRSVTNQNYNNLGQLVYQSAPYALSGTPGSNYVLISNWNTAANYHQFYYDDVGRTTKDETRYQASVLWYNQTLYNVTQTTQYDALNHRRDTDSDVFGHLLAVTEYNVGSTFYNTFYAYDSLFTRLICPNKRPQYTCYKTVWFVRIPYPCLKTYWYCF